MRSASRLCLFGIVFVLLGMLFPSSSAVAFKIDAHIYVAQAVLNDVADGSISIPIVDAQGRVLRTHKISLPSRARRALSRAPEFYRMGSVGPDAFPAVEIGQLVIHPGVRNGWGTAEWLRYLAKTPDMTDQEYAFVLGAFTHAATDVFAHSYVNRYAGDTFEIVDHQLAAKRHVLVESYISKFLPPILVRGKPVPAHQLVVDSKGSLAIPSDFLVSRILFNTDALDQIQKQGQLPYFKLIADLRKDLNDLNKQGGIVDEIEQLAIQIVLKITLDIGVNKDEAKKIREYSEKIHNFTDFSEESMKAVNEVEKQLGKFHSFAKDELAQKFAEYHKAVSQIADAKQRLEAEIKKAADLADEVAKLPDNVVESFTERVCRRCPRWSPGCSLLCDVHQRTRTVRNRVKDAKIQLRERALKAKRELEASIREKHEAAHKATIAAMGAVDQLIKTKIAFNELALEYFKQNQAHSPLRRIIDNWRDDIDKAMHAYVRSNGQTIINTIDPAAAGDVLAPYKDWFSCYALGITGVPVLILQGKCQLEQGVLSFEEKINELEKEIGKISPAFEFVRLRKDEIRKKLEELKQKAISESGKIIAKELSRHIGFDLLLWKKILTTTLDDQGMALEFTKSDPNGLLLIGDVAVRLRKDMNVAGDPGQLDPEKFSALRNSIVLAKLSLLDKAGLQELARREGLANTLFGSFLYGDSSYYSENILYGFVRNIDGNEHWHVQSPPFARVGGYAAKPFEQARNDVNFRYGYVNTACENIKGMRMWLDSGARSALFERLFSGPLVPAIDTPKIGGLKEILPPTYPSTISPNSPWGSGGIDLSTDGKGPVVLNLNGKGSAGNNVRISVLGALPQMARIGPDGSWKMEYRVMPWRAGECALVQELDQNNKIIVSEWRSLSALSVSQTTPVAGEKPVKDTHQKRVYLSAAELAGYIAGRTFSEVGPVGGRQKVFKYGKDNGCFYPRPDPLRGQYVSDRPCKYEIAERGVLCHVFSDGGERECVRMTIFEHGSEMFYPEHASEGWIKMIVQQLK